MKIAISARLSVMMFLEFFIWSAWYVTAPIYLGFLGFDESQRGTMYALGPIAGMISPFFIGMIADRFFSTERVLGVLHLLGGAAMFAAVSLMKGEHPSPTNINWLLFAHMLCYFPTLALVNTLALHTMTNAEKQFPLIRVFGTIGWIVAGLVMSRGGWDRPWPASIQMFNIAGAASILMGLYSFTLPHTPPPAAGKRISIREVLGLDALVLLKRPSYFTFMLCSMLICIPLAFYYQLAAPFVGQAGLTSPAFKMTFGQMSEIVFMLAMPLFFARLGVKWMLAAGMLAWVVRYGLFALGAPDRVAWMILGGIILHGICYDFFFVTGQIYTDKIAPPAIRGQAQGMLVLFTLGLGMCIGAKVAGYVSGVYVTTGGKALTHQADEIGGQIADLQKKINEIGGLENAPWYDRVKQIFVAAQLSAADQARVTELNGRIEKLSQQQNQLLFESNRWRAIWAWPAAGAAVILVLFVLIFRDGTQGRNGLTEGDVAKAAAREELA